MGCTSSIQTTKTSDQGIIKLDEDVQSYCIDELTLDEAFYIREKYLEVLKKQGTIHQSESQQLQFVKVDAQILKKLYLSCNSETDKYIIQQNKVSLLKKSQQLSNQYIKLEVSDSGNQSQYFEKIFQMYLENFAYFLKNGQSQKQIIKFTDFLRFYCIFTKSQVKASYFPAIMFSFLSKGSSFINQNQFKSFLSTLDTNLEQFQTKYKSFNRIQYKKSSNNSSSLDNVMISTLIEKQTFCDYLKTLQTEQIYIRKIKDFQESFNFIKDQKLVYKNYAALKQLLIQEEIKDFKSVGQQVYVVDTKWFHSFSINFQKFYEAKIMKVQKAPKNLLTMNKSKNGSKGLGRKQLTLSSKSLQFSQLSSYVFLKTMKLDYGEIQGQYQKQLKEGINTELTLKAISPQLFQKIKNLIERFKIDFGKKQSEQLISNPLQKYPRRILASYRVNYYPLLIYVIKTSNKTIKIDYTSLKQILIQDTTTLKDLNSYVLSPTQDSSSITYFYKLFEEKNFRQLKSPNEKIVSLSNKQSKLVIALSFNRTQFISKHTRKQILSDNLTVGDKIFAFSETQAKFLPAYVVNKNQKENTVKVHFIGKSWRQDATFQIQQIYLKDSDIQNLQNKLKGYIQPYTGLVNVGNTCYINSSIQCLHATQLFSSLLSVQPINKRSFSYQLQLLFQHLIEAPKQAPVQQQLYKKSIIQVQFKQQITQFFKQFQHWEQHDTQQFIHSILDQLSIEQKGFIEKIFSFDIENQLICASKICNWKKVNKEKMSMITLPIPQPSYIFVQILIIPIYTAKIKKIIVKLQQKATLAQLLRKFEQKSNAESTKFIFVQTQNADIKRVRIQFTNNLKDNEMVSIEQVGIVSNIKLSAYQIVKPQKVLDLIKRNNSKYRKSQKQQTQFVDFLIKQHKMWTIARINRQKQDMIQLEYINELKEAVPLKIPKVEIQNRTYQIENLGSKTQANQPFHIKLYMRKLIPSAVTSRKTMQNFGLPYIITLPFWCTFNDAFTIISEQLQNVIRNAQIGEDFILRFLEPKKQKCIFCDTQYAKQHLPSEDFQKRCCKVFQADVPLVFLSKYKSFNIYIDWKNLKHYNSDFSSDLIIDKECQIVEQEMKNARISLYQCFELLRTKQQVEMTCDQCKNKKMSRQQSISTLPPILIIQLKQYRYVQGSEAMVKLNTNLKIEQVIQIQIDDYLSPNSILKESISYCPLYQLYGIIQHVGSGNSGHYTAVCRKKMKNDRNNQVWVFYDDKHTQVIKSTQLQKYLNNVYMLFYRKKFIGTNTRTKLNIL